MDVSNDRSARSKELWTFAIAFLFFAFDFRRDEIDTQTGVGILLQYMVFSGAALASICFIFSSQAARRAIATPYFTLCLLYVLYVYGVAFFNDISFEMAKSVYPPYACFLMGILMGAGLVGGGAMSERISVWILITGALSIVFRFVYAVSVMGVRLDDMRWQGGTAFSNIIICISLVFLLLRERFSYWAFFAFLLWAVSAFLQVTRTILITMVLIILVCGVVATVRRYVKLNRRFWMRCGVFGAIGVFGLIVSYLIFQERFERWGDRFSESSGSGQVLTLMSRFYDSKGLVDGYGSDPLKWFFGTGVGSVHYFSEGALQDANELGGNTEVYLGTTIAVHNVVINGLKTGGLIGMVVLLVILIVPIVRSGMLVMRRDQPACALPVMLGVVMIASLPSYMLGDPLFDRAGAFLFGFTIGGVVYFKPMIVPAVGVGRNNV